MPSGSCVCGDIAYTFDATPQVSALCHCSDCQKWTGSGCSANFAIPTADFKVTKGSPKAYTRLGESGKEHVHFFCPRCGSSLYSQPAAMERTTLVKTGALSGEGSDLPVQIEFYSPKRRSYETAVDGAKQMKTFLS